ncbi:DNA polymerase Y family protein [Clostridium akagii]|uniref:DNA polymerase Y family protein n=1 Tax=Clostridium akagii TaxID=91623 RepID=UPI00047B3770|nr:DNA polymerase IV [Clostridium akagii]
MKDNKERIIFHIDVNSAFLSWSAADAMKNGEKLDIRDIPSVIGGDESSRRGVVLAKSNSAKKYGIITGESLFSARKKYPNLKVISPCFPVYEKYSKSMIDLLQEYTPLLQQYSIDECFLDVTNDLRDEPIKMAEAIRERIKTELGFTVNIGISNNKLLAKMASEFNKPDKVNTLYSSEIKEKLWPLSVGELFMVGKKATEKLNKLYIYTIGELANYSAELLKSKFKSYGLMIWEYANGIDTSDVECNTSEMKVISNSTTFAEDISDSESAYKVLRSLSENLSTRLRELNKCCNSISVSIRSSDFKNYSHQKKLINPTDSNRQIITVALQLFDEVWKKEPIRLLGVSLTQLVDEGYYQMSLFEVAQDDKEKALDKAIDSIRKRYGHDIISN